MADYWTISVLSNNTGIGKFQEQVPFTMPLGQNGAAVGKYFQQSGSNIAPVFTTNVYTYTLKRNGDCICFFKFDNASLAGAVGGNLILETPIANSGSTMSWSPGYLVAAVTKLGFSSTDPLTQDTYFITYDGVQQTNALIILESYFRGTNTFKAF